MRYFRFLGMVPAFLLITAQASAQTFVEYQNLFSDSGVAPTFDGLLTGKGKTMDAFGWFLVSETWSEAVVGVAKSIRPWMSVSVGVGVDTDDNPWRVGPNVWVGNDRVSSFLILEYGGSGFWYRSMSFAKLGSRVEGGVHSQRFYGTGPAIQVSLNKGYKVWVSGVSGPKSLIAITKSF